MADDGPEIGDLEGQRRVGLERKRLDGVVKLLEILGEKKKPHQPSLVWSRRGG